MGSMKVLVGLKGLYLEQIDSPEEIISLGDPFSETFLGVIQNM